MNPFDLPGPQFLAVYLLFAVATLTMLVLRRRAAESPTGALTLSDPYQIAYLRAGAPEAVRVAVGSLLSRGLLHAEPFAVVEGVTPDQVRSPLERAVLSRCSESPDLPALLDDEGLERATEDVRLSLVRHGLLPGRDVEQERRRRLWLALGLLLGVAAVKVAVALGRGRTNVWFLVILAGLAALIAGRLAAPRRTRRGDDALVDLRELLKHRKTAGPGLPFGPEEAALMSAVFGVEVVAFVLGSEWRWLATHMRSKADASSSSCSSTLGSSCSSGSSGGSSCGSGGSSCGGGGGCGGCGS